MYKDIVVKYNKTIYERYGTEWRYLHTDGPSDQLFPVIVEELKLNLMDIGGWSKLEEAVKYLKEVGRYPKLNIMPERSE